MHGVSDASILRHTKFEAATFIAYAARTLPLKGVAVLIVPLKGVVAADSSRAILKGVFAAENLAVVVDIPHFHFGQ